MKNAEFGIIYKGVGGFYSVKTEEGQTLVCKPRGILRKRGQKPLPGDKAVLREEADTVFIDEILPRRNALVRPPVANIDQLFIVAGTTQPVPSLLVIDKLCAIAIDMGATPYVVLTKTDLQSPDFLTAAYKTSGIPIIVVNAESGKGLDEIKARLVGKLSVFCGNSGVGKSTLLNALLPGLGRQVGAISLKLGRGRHTTREVELFDVGGGLLADTPGFSCLEMRSAAPILPENLQLCFPEIKERIGQCRFSGCAHIGDAGCAVLRAVEEGAIAPGRHNSYVNMYNEAKQAEKSF